MFLQKKRKEKQYSINKIETFCIITSNILSFLWTVCLLPLYYFKLITAVSYRSYLVMSVSINVSFGFAFLILYITLKLLHASDDIITGKITLCLVSLPFLNIITSVLFFIGIGLSKGLSFSQIIQILQKQ